MPRSTTRPTSRLVALAGGAMLLFAVGTNVQAGWVLAIAALLLGILVAGVVIPLSSLRGIEVERRAPRTAQAGAPVPVTLTVTNTGRRLRGFFRINDGFCGSGWAVVGVVQPGQTREFVSDRHDARRGVYNEGIAVLESGMPFGVLRIRRPRPLTSPIVVYPKVFDVPASPATGASTYFSPAAVGDVSSVREYRPGDPLRNIHWRSVARHGRLMVREFDHEHRAEMTVIAIGNDDDETTDAVATIACSLALSALREGSVRLVGAIGGEQRVVTANSGDAVLDWGARLDARPIDLAGALASTSDGSPTLVVAPAIASLDALVGSAGSRPTQAVLVLTRDGAVSSSFESLRAVADVRIVREDEIEPWFAQGCPA
ncbi:MAG: DUF58 domain-containing protein [Actinomycetota bacterium]